MRFSTLFPSAALALTANAFLVPLEVSKHVEINEDSLLPGAHEQTVKLDCPACPIALESDGPVPQEWKTAAVGQSQPSSKLELTFAAGHDGVTLNGVPIYPPNLRSGAIVRAKQTTSEESIRPYGSGVPLSTSVEVRPVEAIVGSDGVMKVHPVSIDILGLADHVVRTDTVRVLVVEGKHGEFMLLPIETTPYQNSLAMDSCTTILCRVKVMIANKIAAFRVAAAARFGMFRTGCMRPKQGHRGPFVKGGPNKFTGTLRPHAHHHKFRHALRRIIRHVVLPIFFGITAGMVVGAFSMLMWTAVASIANRVRGNRPPSYESVAQAEDGVRTSMDDPPKYNDVYEEPEEDVTDEKRQLL